MQPPHNSAIYEGTIRHRRYFPVPHDFCYPIYLSYLDLDELEAAFALHPLYSLERANLVSFRRKDYFGPAEVPLKQAVLDRVQSETGERPDGAVRLLTHLRHFGKSFNPVSFYYCFHNSGELHSVLAEITNTPWDERHNYVLPIARAEKHGSSWHFEFEKAFHVSPFLPMNMHYDWRFQAPGEALRVHMDVYRRADEQPIDPKNREERGSSSAPVLGGEKQFDATLVLQRLDFSKAHLTRSLVRFPLITLSVVWKIYWHALRLWLKGNPFFTHPSKLIRVSK